MYELYYYICLLDLNVKIGIYDNLTEIGKILKQSRRTAGLIFRGRHKLCKVITINKINKYNN